MCACIGKFDFRPYRLVLAVAVIIYFQSLLLSFYYLLPIDENEKKFIPGEKIPVIDIRVYADLFVSQGLTG